MYNAVRVDVLVGALIAGGFAGAVAIAVTVSIERWGGVTGGLIGTVPTTIVPFSIGLHGEAGPLRDALWTVPVGMLVNALFLVVWRELPPRLPVWPLARRLAVVLGCSLALWAAAATSMTFGLRGLRSSGTSLLWPGLTAALVLVAGGLWTSRRRVPAPAGKRAVGPIALALRGVLAATAIAASILIKHAGNEVLSGMVAVFPAIFLTAMVGLWLAQDEAVPAGAVGPMILGSSSVSAYALIGAWSLPAFGPALGAAIAWSGAVIGVTLPAAWWLRRP